MTYSKRVTLTRSLLLAVAFGASTAAAGFLFDGQSVPGKNMLTFLGRNDKAAVAHLSRGGHDESKALKVAEEQAALSLKSILQDGGKAEDLETKLSEYGLSANFLLKLSRPGVSVFAELLQAIPESNTARKRIDDMREAAKQDLQKVLQEIIDNAPNFASHGTGGRTYDWSRRWKKEFKEQFQMYERRGEENRKERKEIGKKLMEPHVDVDIDQAWKAKKEQMAKKKIKNGSDHAAKQKPRIGEKEFKRQKSEQNEQAKAKLRKQQEQLLKDIIQKRKLHELDALALKNEQEAKRDFLRLYHELSEFLGDSFAMGVHHDLAQDLRRTADPEDDVIRAGPKLMILGEWIQCEALAMDEPRLNEAGPTDGLCGELERLSISKADAEQEVRQVEGLALVERIEKQERHLTESRNKGRMGVVEVLEKDLALSRKKLQAKIEMRQQPFEDQLRELKGEAARAISANLAAEEQERAKEKSVLRRLVTGYAIGE